MKRLSLQLSLIVLILAGAWASAKDDSFAVPREEIFSKIKRIGILPMVFEDTWPGRDQAAAEFEKLVTERLTRAGFEIVPSAEYVAIRERLTRESGGWYDPKTGDTDVAKRKTIVERARHEFDVQQRIDARLALGVRLIAASFSGTDAKWHGIKESTTVKQGAGRGLESFLAAGMGRMGNIPALSLAVVLDDVHDRRLYARFGGVQLASVIIDERFVDVDPQFLLADPVRNSRAVKIALDPLVLTSAEARAEEMDRRAATRKGGGARTESENLSSIPTKPAQVQVAAVEQIGPALLVPQADIEKVKTIAIAPASVSISRMIAGLPERIESALSRALTKAGFFVVPAGVYRSAYELALEKAGGFYDPVTGEVVEERRRAVSSAVLDELHMKSNVDAVIFPDALEVVAEQDGGRATWDGVTQSIAQSESALAKLNAAGVDKVSFIPAVSIAVRLVDLNDRDLYRKQSGVQLLRRFAVMNMVDVPDAEIFVAPHGDKAIGLVLAELIDGFAVVTK